LLDYWIGGEDLLTMLPVVASVLPKIVATLVVDYQ
jgi:hypothetical protein